ncbi:fatty acid-binding protein [Leptinotarsa decemlineata]|uniref:fatty acid-binding protein n=1 Tax=Leptinotarsa decemlineata TaxID=7539 RepID=UPI000C251EBF|nr:fatty acid-binding protein-like [Leptinotarsa decemlineata]
MVQISGRYQHVENVNFFELLKKTGATDEQASAGDKTRAIMTVALDGDRVRIKLEGFGEDIENHFVLGQESDEKLQKGIVSKTTVTKEGDTLKFVAKENGSETYSRLYKFTDSGLEVIMNLEGFEAKRIYKRL